MTIKKIYVIMLIILFSFGCKKKASTSNPFDPSNPSGGTTSVWDGTVSQPNLVNGNTYEINNAGELAWIAQESNKDVNPNNFENMIVKLMVNADFQNNTDFKGIAVGGDINRDGTIDYSFNGTFDGNGKKVINIIINTNEYSGFIGHLKNGKVKSLGIEGGNVSGDWTVGGIVGNIFGSNASVENSYYLGSVSGGDNTGGITGHNNGGTIKNCYNGAVVNGRWDSIGGVAGVNYYGTIRNCYNFGKVEGDTQIGGISGNNDGGIIENCYNMDLVNGNTQIGVVVGNNHNLGNIVRCYFIQMGGGINDGKNGIGDGTGDTHAKTYTEFKNKNTFLDWDFSSVWKMTSDRPVFIWQKI